MQLNLTYRPYSRGSSIPKMLKLRDPEFGNMVIKLKRKLASI